MSSFGSCPGVAAGARFAIRAGTADQKLVLVDPLATVGVVGDVNLTRIPGGHLRDFHLRDQDGPLEIARRIFPMRASTGLAPLQAANAEPITVSRTPSFPEVPEDRGHSRESYYRPFLQGLRTSPPVYVGELQRSVKSADITAEPTSRPSRQPRALRGIDVDGRLAVVRLIRCRKPAR